MAPAGLRRSARLTTYDSNGREALADTVGWPRHRLEDRIVSDAVRPHLQLWYRVCVEGEARFKDAIAWINTGERGYYYNPGDLEEDLLLACHGEGNGDQVEDGSGQKASEAGYADEHAQTGTWTTQELWARTAWRIVQNNRGAGQAFEARIEEHPAACYAFAIDLLCVSFHSIAFRGDASCYAGLIKGSTRQGKASWRQESLTFTSNDDYHGTDALQSTENDCIASSLDEEETTTICGSDRPFRYKEKVAVSVSTLATSVDRMPLQEQDIDDPAGTDIIQGWLDSVACPSAGKVRDRPADSSSGDTQHHSSTSDGDVEDNGALRGEDEQTAFDWGRAPLLDEDGNNITGYGPREDVADTARNEKRTSDGALERQTGLKEPKILAVQAAEGVVGHREAGRPTQSDLASACDNGSPGRLKAKRIIASLSPETPEPCYRKMKMSARPLRRGKLVRTSPTTPVSSTTAAELDVKRRSCLRSVVRRMPAAAGMEAKHTRDECPHSRRCLKCK